MYYLAGSVALAMYLWSPASLLRPSLSRIQFRQGLFKDILRVGLVGTVSTVATNLAIGVTTALVGGFGTAAIAGYGTASRLEYLLVPLVFGFGAPMVAMVGTCMGAGQRERALQVTWIGAGLAFGMTEAIGLCTAAFPQAWLSLFDSDPAMIAAGSAYLRAVGPVYGFFGPWPGVVLCLAGRRAAVVAGARQCGAFGRGHHGWLGWPCAGAAVLTSVFLAQALALLIYGVLNAWAIAGGAWFGGVGWPRTTTALLKRMPQTQV